jgi:hypothetical protein
MDEAVKAENICLASATNTKKIEDKTSNTETLTRCSQSHAQGSNGLMPFTTAG